MATLASPSLGKLVTNVRNMLNQPNENNSLWSNLELTEYINEAIRMYFVEVSHCFEGLFYARTTLNITTDTETVDLPSDCFEVKTLRKKVNNGWEILNYRNDLMSGYTTQGGTANDSYFPTYTFRANKLVLRPTPNFSETGGLELEYLQFPDTMLNGGDSMTAQVSPIFKNLIEMYAVYKAKLKQSMVNGVVMHKIPEENLAGIYSSFKEAIQRRSANPGFVLPFNPENY